MKRRSVIIFCFLVTALILGVDAYLYSDNVPRNSITQIVIDLTRVSPLVPWFVGLVMGFLGAHFFDTTSQGDGK